MADVLGGPDYVRLPRLWHGEAFGVRFGPSDPPIDWTGIPVTMVFDGPGGERVTITSPTVESGGGSFVFSQPVSWTNALAVGTWEWHVYSNSGTSSADHIGWGSLEVAGPKGGPP